jgi:SRP54-type protein, GTPase domain
MDGDTRGGSALSVRAVSGKPIKFMGVGEGTEFTSSCHSYHAHFLLFSLHLNSFKYGFLEFQIKLGLSRHVVVFTTYKFTFFVIFDIAQLSHVLITDKLSIFPHFLHRYGGLGTFLPRTYGQ